MSMIWRVFLLVFVLVALVIGAFAIFVNSSCEKTTYSSQISPDGKYKVVHNVVGCGMTTGFSTALLLYRTSLPVFPSNIFELDGEYTDTEVTINWESSSKLRVDYTGRSTDLREISFHSRAIEIEVYENGNKLTPQRVAEIEAEIVKEQATYKITLPEGSHWIEVSP